MKTSIIAVFSAFAAAAFAAPTGDHVRRDLNARGHNAFAPRSGVFVTASGVSSSSPTGTAPSTGSSPTGSRPQPSSTGVPPSGSDPNGNLPSCPVDGVVVCNGPTQFGLCNFGKVYFSHVADGTACVDGEIVGTGVYAAPTATSTQ